MPTRAPARQRRSSGTAGPQGGTSLQGRNASYYRQGATRTVTVTGQGGTHMAGSQGRQVRYQSPSGQRISGTVPKAGLPPKTYHRIILAEFAACIVLVGAAPVLTPRTKASGDTVIADAAVSLAGPLVRLTAVCVLFFVLALMASGERAGKVAAAFGGLVTLGALLNATDMITALGKVFTGQAATVPARKPAGTGIGATVAQAVGNAFGGIAPTPTGAPPAPPIGATG